jgi:hypothetical protein
VTRPFFRLLTLAFLETGLLPLVTVLCARLSSTIGVTPAFLLLVIGSSLVVLLATIAFCTLLRKFVPQLDSNARIGGPV